MLSICVPVYNYDVRPLLGELTRQMRDLPADIELLIYDDASPNSKHQLAQAEIPEAITYQILPHNLGRAAIRNRLSRDAQYPYVLLLDADGHPPPNFLENYLTALGMHRGSKQLVITGGRNYAPTPPGDPALHLHWWYGTRRETPAYRYAPSPFHAFHSNNFVAGRALLLRHPFPEGSVGYGHEDTLWGQQLADRGATLSRIDNPVTHLGLEPADEFLRKQEQAVENLVRLRRAYPVLTTRLTTFYERYSLLGSLTRLIPEQYLKGRLTGRERPNLRALDVLKLRWFHNAQRSLG